MRLCAARAFVLAPSLAVAAQLSAQSARQAPSAAVRRAAETITATDMRRVVGLLAADSMRGRETPSPELEQAAAFVAGEFRRAGLRPLGGAGSFIQRYQIRQVRLDTTSQVTLSHHGASRRMRVGRQVGWLGGRLPDSALTAPAVLLVGMPPDTARPFGDVSVRGAAVLHAGTGPRGFGGLQSIRGLLEKAAAEGAVAWIELLDARSRHSSRLLHQTGTRPLTIAPDSGAAEAESHAMPPVFAALRGSALAALRGAGVEVNAWRGAPRRGARALPGVTLTVDARLTVLSRTSAPNVVGILEGGDPQLHDEYVVVSGHMDHVGVGRPVDGDSIYNGADDNASGTAAVVELAEAFATLEPRPRRSLVFLAVSGEEEGMWGSSFYAEHPAVPLAQTVAAINIDMIGRNGRDSVAVIGGEHSSLGRTAERVAREHPELRMRLVGDAWPRRGLFSSSDQISFARRGVPAVFFHSGPHPDLHKPSDTVERIDAEKAARVVRTIFYLGLEVANTVVRPSRDPAARARFVGVAGH